MSVNYVCEHCHSLLGRLEAATADDVRLGFHQLTEEEHRHYVQHQADGHITVRMTCDLCQEAYSRHPELAFLASPLQ
ncbi:anti-sigma-F factor Fin [Paenibacillus arenosi]|uniref:DUF2757 family protein n=1 Tax=Paenibacillus arenosi TaxID=2774142 RepID=A0ABR9B2T1_9BACL|nr:anti-sigma-F factor Fin [Paenibacillus arenosi]MBD8500679.1 DUF2757 family protein [Paenibacillus arenosi]